MKKLVEWENEKGKIIRLRIDGKSEDAERTVFHISQVWKSKKTKLIIIEGGEEKTAFEIIRA